MTSGQDTDLSSLEKTREALYQPVRKVFGRAPLSPEHTRDLPHVWAEDAAPPRAPKARKRLKFSAIFLGASFFFFLIALGTAAYVLYFGGNSVSVDKIDVSIQGPTTIAGGDTVPLSVTITNRNPVPLKNATLEVDFPEGTRSATDVLSPYPRYVEDLGTVPSGATVVRTIKAVIFGAAGQTVTLPLSLSFGTENSNAIFTKKNTYALAISSTPLSVSVDSLAETVSGKPLTFTLAIRSNAAVPLSNVVLQTSFPFGFTVTSSSVPLKDANMFIGTIAPGATKQVTLTGTLIGQDKEQRVFHFTVGTATSPQDPTLAVTYMTQDATVLIAAPFLSTDLAFNGNPAEETTLAPGALQNVSVSYANTLATTLTNASVKIALSGTALDYSSITVSGGFYDSATKTIVFSPNTDASLASLAPGATGSETFSFSTVPTAGASPTADFSISVSGTRVGQANVPEQISASIHKTLKMTTAVTLSGIASHLLNEQSLNGPIPPRTNQATTYAIRWNLKNTSNAVAGGTVTATLPDYVSYANVTSGDGSFSYDDLTRTLTWTPGDLAQNATATGVFEVVFTPSTSQKGDTVKLVNQASFSGYDRFAETQVSATMPAVTTAISGDPGYSSTESVVQ